MSRRLLLSVQIGEISPISAEELESAGWQVIAARGIKEAKRLFTKFPDCHTGVLTINKGVAARVDELDELLMLNSSMEWIVLLPSSSIESTHFCRFIIRS